MTDLGAVLSSMPPPPPHVRKLSSSLLTKSLLRPAGVRALFAAVFGEQESSDDPPLEKYERTASILMAVPAGLKSEVCIYPAVATSPILTVHVAGIFRDHHPSFDGIIV